MVINKSRKKFEFCNYNKTYFMSALFLLVTISILVAGVFLGAFIWSVKNNQFEDQKGAAMRILLDDEIAN